MKRWDFIPENVCIPKPYLNIVFVYYVESGS